jgi:sorbitol-specific phosphotransferase system component IIC
MTTIIITTITLILTVFLIISLLFEKKVYRIADRIGKSGIGFLLVVMTIITISVVVIIQANKG